MFKKIAGSLLAITLALASSLVAAAAGDVLKKVLTPFAGGSSWGVRPLMQADGKILIVGNATFGTQQFAVTRYNPNGSVDSSYGAFGNGTQLQPVGPGNATATAAALQADGKLVVAGRVMRGPSASDDVFAVARFNADGTTDTTFSGGTIAMPVGSGRSGAQAVAIQADGKILVGGFSNNGGRDVFTVIRFNADGTLDFSYGPGGTYIETPDPAMHATVNSMAVQADGKLVLAGYGNGILKTERLNSNGTLDTTWGGGGSYKVGAFREGSGMALQLDGKVLVSGGYNVGVGSDRFAVARFTTSGQLDATFGSGGIATTPTGTGEAPGVVLQPDGKIVISGFADDSSSDGFWIARFLSNGTPDATFGSNGVAVELISPYAMIIGGIALRADGSFIIPGSRAAADLASNDTAVVAFTATGALDTSFSGTGYSLLDLGSRSARATSSAIQADGKIVVAGTFVASGDFGVGSVVARYLASGDLDTSFGTGGFTLFNARNTEAVAIHPDGKIVTGGMQLSSGDPSINFARFNADGTFDTSFGSGGMVTFPTAVAREWVKAIAIQPDGRIVGAGLIKDGALTDSYVVRITTSGALDTTFGVNGFATVSMSTLSDEFYGVALQPDGKIVVAGRGAVTESQSHMTAARLDTNGALDASFGAGGKVVVDFTGGESWANGVAVQADGKIVLGGFAHPATNSDFALARLNADGTLDASFGSGGLVTTDFEFEQNGLQAVKVLPSGKIVGAGWDVGGTFGVVQYLANGALDTTFGSGGHRAIAMNGNAGADVAYSISVASDGTLYVAGDASHMFGLTILAGPPPRATPSVSLGSSPNPSAAGQGVTFVASVSGSGATPTGTVAFRDGSTELPGCSAVTLSGGAARCTASSLAVGSHSITASYSGDAAYAPSASVITTQSVVDASSNPPRLGNLSTRGQVLTGNDVMISGFIVGGSTPKTLVINVAGPSLANYGITNGLANPTLRLVRSSDQSVIAANDDWQTQANPADVAAIQASGFQPNHSLEPAIIATLPPGAYTAIVQGSAGGTGVGVVGVFEVDHFEVPLVNISTRGQVLTGNDVMIGGFIVQGAVARTVVVNVAGPSLANYGITNALANPKLTLVRSSDQAIIAANDDWQTQANPSDVAAIQAAGFQPNNPLEPAVIMTLQPGAYTAIVEGVGGTTGVALVGVFSVP